MFTGIIEEVGTVQKIARQHQALALVIQANVVLADVKIGDSIAVNGVCLTVIAFTATSFTADVMPETFQATSLAQLSTGDGVNLERAMLNNSRFGGHIVSGHVDGTAVIAKKRPLSNAVYIDLRMDAFLLRYCIERGSITIDGTSLTIFEVRNDGITVSLIPHTYAETMFSKKREGAIVNIENDVIAKYVEKLTATKQTLSSDFLAQHGY